MAESDRAERMIEFIETLRIPEGMHVGMPFRLRDWQRKIIREVYGPVDGAGRRICRQAVLSIPRKNGKTPLVTALCLGHLCGPEAIRNAQLYSVAFGRDQAAIVFRYMRQMVEMDAELSVRLIIRETTKEIEDPISGSIFKALSAETKGKHGMGPAFLVYDELAQFGADRTLYDTMMTGRGAHAEPLSWVISTQAPSDNAVLSELIDYGLKVNQGEIEDPTFKCFLFAAPKDADAWNTKVWHECNPALGDFRSLTEMQELAIKAQRMPGSEASFRNLYLNQRIDAAAHFIGPTQWKACGAEPDLDLFEQVPCYGGLDLSAKNDLTALVLVACDQEGVWHVWCFFWTPADSLREREDRDKAPYTLWRDQGFLEAKPGKTIDYGWVAQKIAELHGHLSISRLKFDRWRIDDLQRELDKIGIDAVAAYWQKNKETGIQTLVIPDHDSNTLVLIPHGQGYQDMNPAIETLEDLIIEERIRHGMHPVLTWCASNTRVQRDPAWGRKFDKLKSSGRIDGLVAMAMALNGAVSAVESGDNLNSVLASRGLLSL